MIWNSMTHKGWYAITPNNQTKSNQTVSKQIIDTL